MNRSLVAVVAAGLILSSSVPAVFASYNNYIEGNWTSWALYDKQDINAQCPTCSGSTINVKQSMNGAILSIGIQSDLWSYTISTKTLALLSATDASFCQAGALMECSQSAYGTYIATSDSATSTNIQVYTNSGSTFALVQTLLQTTYGWNGAGAAPFPGFDPTGQWLIVDSKDGGNANHVTIWLFQGVGNVAQPPPAPPPGSGGITGPYVNNTSTIQPGGGVSGCTTTTSSYMALNGTTIYTPMTNCPYPQLTNINPLGLIIMALIGIVAFAFVIGRVRNSGKNFASPGRSLL